MAAEDEDDLLRSVALQNVQSILAARQRAERELLATKNALEEETRILEILHETGAMLASQLDLEGVVQAVTDAGTRLSGAQYGAFFCRVDGPEGDAFKLYALSGAPRSAFEKLGDPRVTPLLAATFRDRTVVRLADVRRDPRYGRAAPHHGMPAEHPPVGSYLALPVISRSGNVLGGLLFGHADPDMFTERSERLVVGLAAQAAIAVDNARLYEEAKRSADERARLLAAERAARTEVERISLMKDEFLATLSHELRTPLNAVLGWAQILLARAKEDDDARRALETISRNARAQAQLIDDLLDMSRIVSGKLRLDVQRFDLVPVVEAALDSVGPSVIAKSLRLTRVIDPDAGLVYGDPHRIQQVVWNLLSNAVKFTPRGGKIDVVVRRVESHIEILVQDDGLGIDAGFLPNVFDRFRQADASISRKHGGLGLGLAIVKQLVELHGGTVRAQSGGEGTGAIFIVTLPARAVQPGFEPVQPAAASPDLTAGLLERSLAGTTVLVVDDEWDAREILKTVLAEAAAEVFTASSAHEALALVSARRPDVIVSDIGMPDRDGYQFMNEVRSLPPEAGGRIPAIALTAFARSADRTRALLAGYQVHVSKPVEPLELVAAVRSLVQSMGKLAP